MALRHYNPSSLWFIVQEGAERDCCWRSETQWDSPCHSRGSASLSAKPSCHPQVLQQLPGERRLLHHHRVLWGKSSFGNTWVSFFRSFLVIISLKQVTWSGPVNCVGLLWWHFEQMSCCALENTLGREYYLQTFQMKVSDITLYIEGFKMLILNTIWNQNWLYLRYFLCTCTWCYYAWFIGAKIHWQLITCSFHFLFEFHIMLQR